MRSTALLLCLQLHLAVIFAEELAVQIRPPDSTRQVRESHVFTCNVHGDDPISVRWQKMNTSGAVNIKPSHSEYQLRNENRELRFMSLSINHTGYYRCVAKNSQGEVSSQYAYLFVQAKAEIFKGPSDRHVPVGTNLSLECHAVGHPTPTIYWTKNGGHKVTEPETGADIITRSRILVTATENAEYTCVASNQQHNADGFAEDSKSSKITVYVPTPKPPDGRCQLYNGTICEEHRGGKFVFYNNSEPELNERIVLGLQEEMLSTFTNRCRPLAEKMLCHYAFPDCDISQQHPHPKPLCREDCLAVKDMFCSMEWLMIEENKSAGLFFKHRGHFRLPDCHGLHRHLEHHDSCTKIDIFLITEDKLTNHCIEGDGRYYVGKVNQTREGLPCQHWSSQSPHLHNRTAEVFPILDKAGNACRNPGGEESQPWCYTQDPHQRWQPCDIPRCESDIVWTTAGSVDSNELNLILSVETVIIISIVSVVVVFLIVLIAVLVHRILNLRPHSRYDVTPQEDLDLDIEQLPNNVSYSKNIISRTLLSSRLEKLEYPRNDIVYLRDIGYGAFGRVFQAKAPRLMKGQEWITIAVKMLKEEASEELQKDFEREASLMVEFNHPNILKLLGVCAVGSPPCLLFEFMSKGDLNDFLRNCSPEHYLIARQSEEVSDSGEVPKLDHIEQLQIAKQVASGMVYISDKGYIHRDLATRNCLVGDGLTVKIADFGLTRNLVGDYYKGSEHDAIPIRWMPLEAILYNRFTVKSDAWSFGVVLWEIFSFALQPYYGMTHEEVIKYIQDGETLQRPENTPEQVYDLMKQCWAVQPLHRPTFSSIHKAISVLQDDLIKRKKKQEKDRDKA